MDAPLDVMIVSNSPIYAGPLKWWLERPPHAFRCKLLDTENVVGSPGSQPARLLIVPQVWRELAQWLPCLRKRFAEHPWLLLGDLRLGGMFCTSLEEQRCTLVAPGESLDRLRASLWALAEGGTLLTPGELPRLLSRNIGACFNGEATLLTRAEVQCACAISLGLTYRQMGEVLHLGEGTVRIYTHHVMRKLQVAHREELAGRVERALVRLSSVGSAETGVTQR